MKDVDGELYGHGLVGPLRQDTRGTLNDRYWISPFSLWNSREVAWQRRKIKWLKMGIKSEIGRSAYSYHQDSLNKMAIKMAEQKEKEKGVKPGGKRKKPKKEKYDTGTSIFDPVVCELCYNWFCPPGGQVIDPFAGGSVRGIVAGVLGLQYWGCDLSKEQVKANREQRTLPTIAAKLKTRPIWVCGDSLERLPNWAPEEADFIFSCPPYGCLEVYSDDTRDISNMPQHKFIDTYKAIIKEACQKLKPDSFACFVVGNYRDRETKMMVDLNGITIEAFQAVGLGYYNDVVLMNAVGTAPQRVNTNFLRGHRKVVKIHQNVLVFLKGNAKRAADKIPHEETK